MPVSLWLCTAFQQDIIVCSNMLNCEYNLTLQQYKLNRAGPLSVFGECCRSVITRLMCVCDILKMPVQYFVASLCQALVVSL